MRTVEQLTTALLAHGLAYDDAKDTALNAFDAADPRQAFRDMFDVAARDLEREALRVMALRRVRDGWIP